MTSLSFFLNICFGNLFYCFKDFFIIFLNKYEKNKSVQSDKLTMSYLLRNLKISNISTSYNLEIRWNIDKNTKTLLTINLSYNQSWSNYTYFRVNSYFDRSCGYVYCRLLLHIYTHLRLNVPLTDRPICFL